MIGDVDLVDIWRVHKPETQSYTCRCSNYAIFLSGHKNLYSFICQYSVHFGHRSEHTHVNPKIKKIRSGNLIFFLKRSKIRLID